MKNKVKNIIDEIEKNIVGKREKIVLALTCLLADGHLLIEDLPGVGKTSLANSIAKVMGLDFQRIQCTSDMLPGDILGASIFDPNLSTFTFHQGPAFTHVLLADEINRTTPKTQSALLEAMEEKQISMEGKTYRLKLPFFVIATQNPDEQAGVFPLPESQLDRFLFKIDIGYPKRDAEKKILKEKHSSSHSAESIMPILNKDEVIEMQNKILSIKTSDPLIDYLQDIIDYTRNSGIFKTGLSPRAGINILKAAKAFAGISSRDYVLPDDIQTILPWACSHRLLIRSKNRFATHEEIREMLHEIKIP